MEFALLSQGEKPDWVQSIERELRSRGHRLELVDRLGWLLARDDYPDGGWVRFVPGSFTNEPPLYWQAARALERGGTRLLNSTTALEIGADKLVSALAFRDAGLPHPEVWELADADWSAPRVVKPLLGARGVGVALCASAEAATRHQEETGRRCLAQRRVDACRCLRLVATPERVIKTYEKAVEPGVLVASVSQGADRVVVRATAEMARLARQAVAAVGCWLMGVDLLEEADGRLWVLEANGSFAFDPDDREISGGFVDELERRAGQGI